MARKENLEGLTEGANHRNILGPTWFWDAAKSAYRAAKRGYWSRVEPGADVHLDTGR